MSIRIGGVAALLFCLVAGVAAGGSRLAELRIERAVTTNAEVAIFHAVTAMDLPGGGHVLSRLEIQCSGGSVNYVLIDFGTPRLSKETGTLDVELAQYFAGVGEDPNAMWRIEYYVLAWQEQAPTGPSDLRNIQLNYMLYRGNPTAFVERLVEARYLAVEQPAARGGGNFVFELTHLEDDIERFRSHCGV